MHCKITTVIRISHFIVSYYCKFSTKFNQIRLILPAMNETGKIDEEIKREKQPQPGVKNSLSSYTSRLT